MWSTSLQYIIKLYLPFPLWFGSFGHSARRGVKDNVNPTSPSKRQCSNTKRVFGCHISILIVKIVKQCFIKLPMTPGKIQVLNMAHAANRHIKYLCNPCHKISPLTPQQCKLRYRISHGNGSCNSRLLCPLEIYVLYSVQDTNDDPVYLRCNF